MSDRTVSDGGTVTFSGSGFLPFEKVSINIDYGGSDSSAAFRRHVGGGFVLAAAQLPRRARLTVTADAHGAFSITVRLTEIGNATLVATGLTTGRTVTSYVKVVAPSDGDDKKPTTPRDKKPTTPRDDNKPTNPRDHDKPTTRRDNKTTGAGDDNKAATPGDGDHSTKRGHGTALPTTGPGGVPLLIGAASGVGLVSFGTAMLMLVRGRRRRSAADR